MIERLVFDLSTRNSVAACVTAARENARQVREEISSDMWEQINALFLRLNQARTEGTWSARPHYLARLIIEGVHLFEGITDATMGHGEGWQYLQAGRFLERAGATAALVDLHVNEGSLRPPAHPEWVGLLRSCSALEANCRCYTAFLKPDRIAEFLLLNAEFPRSVRFAAARAESAVRSIAQIALVRGLGMPCRYVSGYLFQHGEAGVRSTDGATHAWVEVLTPDRGWIGFDPTNTLVAGDHHIRVAIGRDYADVPPTRGVYKGISAVRSELAVGVSVGPALAAISREAPPFVPWMSREAAAPLGGSDSAPQQQQQSRQ